MNGAGALQVTVSEWQKISFNFPTHATIESMSTAKWWFALNWNNIESPKQERSAIQSYSFKLLNPFPGIFYISEGEIDLDMGNRSIDLCTAFRSQK